MKTAYLINVLLAVAVVLLSIRLVTDHAGNKESATEATETSEVSAMDNIVTRTSIRDYTDKTVSDDTIEQLLKAAMAAPSARNQQPWRFIVIKDKKTLQAVSENFHTMKMAEKAPLAIVVCGDVSSDYWVQDASAATENLLLAAHAMGLGAVWCGIYPKEDRVEKLKEMLDISGDIMPLNVIPVGYPAENPLPKDKWDPKKICYEKWDREEK